MNRNEIGHKLAHEAFEEVVKMLDARVDSAMPPLRGEDADYIKGVAAASLKHYLTGYAKAAKGLVVKRLRV